MLLQHLQMPCCWAALISSSRVSGWAMLIKSSAFPCALALEVHSAVFRDHIMVMVRGTVTMPRESESERCGIPFHLFYSLREDRQTIPLPPST